MSFSIRQINNSLYQNHGSHTHFHIQLDKYCIFLTLLLDECGTMWEQAWASPSQLVHWAVDKGRPYQRYVTTHIVTDGTPAHGWYNNRRPTSCKCVSLCVAFYSPVVSWHHRPSLFLIYKLEVIKFWRWQRPGNEAILLILYQLDGAHKTTNWLILDCSL